MDKFAKLILAWYARHARKLPWRNHPDPYAVWVSEIMLQQTQVATVIPYFERWMKEFPDIPTLVVASEQEVLSLWEGLGYYARVRNLYKAANLVLSEYGGVIPRNIAELQKLPGIGRYTAAAIVSMAFGVDAATLDGNLRRVLARVFNLTLPANSSRGEKILWEIAEHHLPKGHAGEYNQALMDLGATICLPQTPLCPKCPVRNLCEARALGVQDVLPVVKKKSAVPIRIQAAAVVVRDGKVLIVRRPSKGLLGGMWEFPASPVNTDPALGLPSIIKSAYKLKVIPVSPFATLRHAYTHFKLTEYVFLCTLRGEDTLPENCRWIQIAELDQYPMGNVDRRIARKLMNGNG
jgi:A/G-specific adenine glycosylase